MVNTSRPRTIFLSYSHDDSAEADRLRSLLHDTGVEIRHLKSWPLTENTAEAVRTAVAASDVIVVLLSPSYITSAWSSKELSASIEAARNNRAISVWPALLADCEVPAPLRTSPLLDLREAAGVEKLKSRLHDVGRIDLGRLAPAAFEGLVALLLREMGLEVEQAAVESGAQWDLLAHEPVKGPLGSTTLTWAVDVKQYNRDGRLGVSAIHQALNRLAASPAERCLLVTNSQLTSVSRSFLDRATQDEPERVQLWDGNELTARLLEHPDVVEAFFGSEP